MNKNLKKQLEKLKKTSYILSYSTIKDRNLALKLIKKEISNNIPKILKANKKDLCKMNATDPLYDRLLLNEERIKSMCTEIDMIISLKDPLGKTLEKYKAPSGIDLEKISVPIGIIGVIYEARPNVTTDVTALCLKSGNAVMLRGSNSAYESNKILCRLIHQALKKSKIPSETIQLLSPDREIATEMMKANQYLDMIIPRGGKKLIQKVREESTIPVIETGASVVHTYVDKSANIDMACNIVFNEKTRRPSVCNTVDTVLINRNIASSFLPELAKKMEDSKTIFHLDSKSLSFLKNNYPKQFIKQDAKDNYDHEFLSLEMNIHIVSDIDEAIDHIRKYSLKHSESIITENRKNAEKFLKEVDAACVFVNTSTAFSDGAQFGLGAEIGISTQKLHARGPMGIKELTSYKWLIRSNGKIRV